MKIIKNFILFSIFLFQSVYCLSQVTRNDQKKIIAYRSHYQRMATGSTSMHSIEIRNGELWGWGDNTYGQLGDTSKHHFLVPIKLDSASNWVLAATGGWHSLAIKADGSLWAWGLNDSGQLGLGSTTNEMKPIQVGKSKNWVGITAGLKHSLALASDGTIWGWGNNDMGQLGDSTTSKRISPLQIGVHTNWTKISAGAEHTLALKSNGTIWVWGRNNFNQLAKVSSPNNTIPSKIGVDSSWTYISSGGYHCLAIKANGSVWSWGCNTNGQLGLGGVSKSYSAPQMIGKDRNWVMISAGYNHSLGLTADGIAWSWGDNQKGQLGNTTSNYLASPTAVDQKHLWVTVAAGRLHSLGVAPDGVLWGWGDNATGQIGDATYFNSMTPKEIYKLGNAWLQLSAGRDHTLALRSDGTIWSWGDNYDAQLGDGTHTSRGIPKQIGKDHDWIAVQGGHGSSYAIKADGSLWSWGRNTNGELGHGNNEDTFYTPHKVSKADWVSLSTCFYSVIGLRANGTIWGCGYNTYGWLGFGNNAQYNKFTAINNQSDWVMVYGNFNFSSHILKANGSLWGAGRNNYGELGDGTTSMSQSMKRVGSSYNWTCVRGGLTFTTALQPDGKLYSWGYNGGGYFGDGTYNDSYNPTLANNAGDIIALGGTSKMNQVLKCNGTLWGCGENSYGELGSVSSGTNKLTKIGSDSDWVHTSVGEYWFSMAVHAHRKVYCGVGNNNWMQLGDGGYSNRSSYSCNNAQPSGPFVIDKKICYGDQLVLKADGLGIIQWYSDSSLTNLIYSGSAWLTDSIKNDTLFYVCDSTLNGRSQAAKVTITVTAKPKSYLKNHQLIECVGDTISLGDTSINGLQYYWYNLQSNFVTQAPSFQTTASRTTTYYLKVSSGDCIYTDSIELILKSSPKSNLIQFAKVCLGDTLTLQADSGAHWVYHWSGAVYISTNQNHKIQVKPSQNTSIYLSIQDTMSSCWSNDSVRINIKNKPQIFLGKDHTICAGDSVLIGDSSKIGVQYSWGSTMGSLPDSNSFYWAKNQSNQSYWLMVKDTLTGCINADTVQIYIHQLPTIKLAKSKSICTGDSLILVDSFLTPSKRYEWLDLNKNILTKSAYLKQLPLSNTQYYILVKDTITGCLNHDSVQINILKLPNVHIIGANSICSGDTIELADSLKGAFTYNWYSHSNASISTNSIFKASPLNSTTFYLTVIDTISSCMNSDSIYILVRPLPAIQSTPDENVCKFSIVTLGKTNNSSFDYWWTDGSSFQSNQSMPSVEALKSQLYYLKVTDKNTTCNSFDTVLINVKPLPNKNVVLNGNILEARQDSALYQWIDCNKNNQPINGAKSRSYSPSTHGKYAVIITLNGCVDTSDCSSLNVGIEPALSNLELSLFPNPTNGYIYMQINNNETVKLKSNLEDITGKILITGDLTTLLPGTHLISLDLTQYPVGMYILVLDSGESRKYIKIQKI